MNLIVYRSSNHFSFLPVFSLVTTILHLWNHSNNKISLVQMLQEFGHRWWYFQYLNWFMVRIFDHFQDFSHQQVYLVFHFHRFHSNWVNDVNFWKKRQLFLLSCLFHVYLQVFLILNAPHLPLSTLTANFSSCINAYLWQTLVC